MNDHRSMKISIVCSEIKMDLRVTPMVCFGIGQFARMEYTRLSDFAYGEYLFFIKNAPTYYFNALSSNLEGTTLKKWIDDASNGMSVEKRMLSLFRFGGIENVGLRPCSKGLNFPLGKSYIKQFDILEIRDVEFN